MTIQGRMHMCSGVMEQCNSVQQTARNTCCDQHLDEPDVEPKGLPRGACIVYESIVYIQKQANLLCGFRTQNIASPWEVGVGLVMGEV